MCPCAFYKGMQGKWTYGCVHSQPWHQMEERVIVMPQTFYILYLLDTCMGEHQKQHGHFYPCQDLNHESPHVQPSCCTSYAVLIPCKPTSMKNNSHSSKFIYLLQAGSMILVITRLMSSECRSVKCLYTFCEYLDLNFLILCLCKVVVPGCVYGESKVLSFSWNSFCVWCCNCVHVTPLKNIQTFEGYVCR